MLEDPRTSSLPHHMAHFTQAALGFMPQTDGDADTEASESGTEEEMAAPREAMCSPEALTALAALSSPEPPVGHSPFTASRNKEPWTWVPSGSLEGVPEVPPWSTYQGTPGNPTKPYSGDQVKPALQAEAGPAPPARPMATAVG